MIPDVTTRRAFIVVCIALAVSAVGFRGVINAFNLWIQKEPVALRASLKSIPDRIGRWQKNGDDADLSAEMRESLGTDLFLDRFYAIPTDPAQGVMNVHLAYYTGMIDTVPHVPERCAVAGGWIAATPTTDIDLHLPTSTHWPLASEVNVATGKPYPSFPFEDPVTRKSITIFMPVGTIQFRTTEFQHPDHSNARLLAGYFFVANGQIASSAQAVKAMAFNLSDRYAYYCKVQFSMMFPASDSERWTHFNERSSELLDDLLPRIMQCLPSWPEWEAKTAQSGYET